MRRLPIPWATVGIRAQIGLGALQDLGPAAAGLGEVEDLPRLVGGQPAAAGIAGFGQLVDHGLATDLGELVECPEHRPATAGESLGIEKPVEDLAVIERDREVRHAGRRRVRRG